MTAKTDLAFHPTEQAVVLSEEPAEDDEGLDTPEKALLLLAREQGA